ncbi:hypothetical protein SCLCIDRAFT_975800 [Scleroderma citrinum Foug A]|uniref:VWFA domain-containing protein n=1 Tax=Scleroderma citrinum Foug A TaxID=1036808 RepID=A0A0C3A5M2_9AGAM|nr:hypothetical protein SCLCIDRAFT_975800 [Scleroderma citrinum Foug A]
MPATLSWEALASSSLIPPWATQNQDTSIPGLQTQKQPRQRFSFSDVQAISTLIPPRVSYNQGILVTKQRKQELSEQVCDIQQPSTFVLTKRQQQEQSKGQFLSSSNQSKTFMAAKSSISSRFIIKDYLRESAAKIMSESMTVFLVDEALSAAEGNLFLQAREAIAGIVEICANQGFRGVDVHLLHQDVFAENILSVDDLTEIFAEVQLDGTDAPTGARLAQLIERYLPLIESKESTHPPINIIVMSGSVPTDPDTLVECIVDAAQRLDMSGVRPDMFGIQFAQMGAEEVTNQVLCILGDNFGARNNVREIVTTISFDPAQGTFDSSFMIKILLGGIRKLFETKAIVQSALVPLSNRISSQATNISKALGSAPTTNLNLTGGFGRPLGKFPRF